MIKKIVLLLLSFSLLLTTQAFTKTFGAGLTLKEATPLSTVLASPDSFVGKKVQVKGMILEVCERRGCWMYIAGDKPFEKIRVKVVDGEIVFPMEARGRQGTVEGIVQKFVLSRAQVIAQMQHYAEEQGETFDPSTVKSGQTIYQLRGLGAEIEGL
jgi:hypothetical protein